MTGGRAHSRATDAARSKAATVPSRAVPPPASAASLRLSEPSDPLEREADRVADRVMRMTAGTVMRACSCNDDDDLPRAPASGAGGGGAATGAVARSEITPPDAGRPLAPAVRSWADRAFGADLSSVQVHTGAAAARAAAAVDARAYTIGDDIVFGRGQYRPDTGTGRRLLAHELTHVLQTGATAQRVVRRVAVCQSDPSTAPPMACTVAISSPAGPGLDIFFPVGSSTLTPADVAALHNLVQNWHAAGGGVVRVDGFASCDGSPALNWPLSCERTLAVAHELLFPSDPTLTGIDQTSLDMFANGETDQFGASQATNRRGVVTLVGPPPPPPATAALFTESPRQQFHGYDASVNPDFQVVPTGETRIADVIRAPATAQPTYVPSNPAVATVQATATGVEITGVTDGNTTIEAREGATVLDTLRVEVKDQRTVTVDYHFMRDTPVTAFGFTVTPQHRTARATGSAGAMTATLNRIWQRQANVRFRSGTVDTPTVPRNLGPQVVWTAPGGEWVDVVAFSTGGEWNVFLVWEYEQDATPAVDDANAGTGRGVQAGDTLLEDNDCPDGLTLSHEGGHFLSNNSLPHTASGIMGPCGAPNYDRVTKAEADAVNA